MTIVIAVDAMGGDHAPAMVVDGLALAARKAPGRSFLLFGNQERLHPLVRRHQVLRELVTIRHTEEAVAADARPAVALRQSRNSSMRLAINAVHRGEAAAAVSAGNTGALMAMAKFVLKTLPGIDRPAIAALLPTKREPVVMLDLGANVDCGAEHLFQFAVMGEVYARAVRRVSKPRVGLLNVGTEEVKGDSVVKEAAALIRDRGLKIAYHGFVEGNDVTAGKVDVVVTDGFTGNVALKIAEGTSELFAGSLREAFQSSWRAKLGYLFARPALQRLRNRFDPRMYNGAMFLGLNGIVVKSHGGTDAIGFANAVDTAAHLVEQGTNERIIRELRRAAAGDSRPGSVQRAVS